MRRSVRLFSLSIPDKQQRLSVTTNYLTTTGLILVTSTAAMILSVFSLLNNSEQQQVQTYTHYNTAVQSQYTERERKVIPSVCKQLFISLIHSNMTQ